MTSVKISGYVGGNVLVHVSLDPTDFLLPGLFPTDQYFLGCSVIKPGAVYDYSPIVLQQTSGLFGATSQDLAFTVPKEVVSGGTIVVAVWKGFPSPTAIRIAEDRQSGTEVLQYEVVNPIQQVGEGLINTATTVPTMIPMLLMLGVLAFAITKGGK